MSGPLRRLPLYLLIACIGLLSLTASAETGFLVVHVEDVRGHPIRGVQIGVKGDGGSDTSNPNGQLRIRLAVQTQAKDWVTLQVLHSPPGKDLVLLSPWDSRAVVPSFENRSDNFVDVVVVESGDRAALTSPAAVRAFAEKINKANAPKSAGTQATADPKANLEAVAKQFGLTPEEVDKAISAWGEKTRDPYEAGLAALYTREYPKASALLQDSLNQREAKLTADQETVSQDRERIADAACFLGPSRNGQDKYRESAQAYERCLQLRHDDPVLLTYAAWNFESLPDLARAEPLFRRALAIHEKTLGPDHPDVADDLINLADLLQRKGDSAAAEPLSRRALAIDEKALGPNHPNVSRALNNLAVLLITKGDDAEAEQLLLREMKIDEGASDREVLVNDLDNLSNLYFARGDYARSESFDRRALSVAEKALGPDDPLVAMQLTYLANQLTNKGDYAAAEPLYRRALAIDEKALAPDHPTTRGIKQNLEDCLQKSAQAAAQKPKN